MNPRSPIHRLPLTLLLLLGALVLSLPATLLAGFEIDILYDDTADFSTFKTYRWATDAADDSPEAAMVDGRIKRTTDANLAKKGLRLAADGETPDLLITYYGGIDNNLLIEGVRFELAPRVVWTGAAPLEVTRRYEVGTLVLDFADAETEKIVWSGVVKARAATTRQLRDKVEKAVQKVLKQYPPR